MRQLMSRTPSSFPPTIPFLPLIPFPNPKLKQYLNSPSAILLLSILFSTKVDIKMVREEEAFSSNSKVVEASMFQPPVPPGPSSLNSSAPTFKINFHDLNPSHTPALPTLTSPAARDVVLGVIAELRARGHLTNLEVAEDLILESSAPSLFGFVVSAYMAETKGLNTAKAYPVPPPAIASGQNVDLLHLYRVVCSHGGFSAVESSKSSWEAVSMDIGLHSSAHPEIKMMYCDYIAPLEICIRDTNVADVSHSVVQCFEAKVEETASLTMDSPLVPLASRKRKLMGTLNWLRTVAMRPDELGMLKPNFGGHVSTIVQLRHQMCANIDCRPLTNWKALKGMLDWVRCVATSPDELGVVGEDFNKHFATALQVRDRMFAADETDGLPNVEITQCDMWDEKVAADVSTRGIFGPRVHPSGQADIPEWTGKPSLLDEDPSALLFLGEPLWTPENDAELRGGSIGKGRQEDCSKGPGSIGFVRDRVAEKRSELKSELGPAFSKMGLDRMGEDVALAWTRDEETRFHKTIQQNRSSPDLWQRLLDAFTGSRSREEIVSYYYNVYLIRTKARQNRSARKSACTDYDPLG